MEQYRPTYNMVLEANDYTLIEFIKASFFRYQQHPEARRLPPLVPATGQ
jgi:hypothetical protein